MKHLYTYGLSLLLVTSLATATSITTTAPGYSSASEITLNIEGRLSGDKDWVGIYKKGSTSDWNNVLGWSWVQHRTSGLTIDTIIDNGGYSGRDILVDGGEFEARLFYHNSYSAEASTPFYMINEGRPHFMIVPKPFDVGDTIEVEVNTILSGDKDWVGIYPKNSDSSWTNVIAWNWVESNGIVAINKLRPGKTMSAGEYEARLFFHNSYTVEERDAFILRNAIETVKDTYRVNEQVTINISTTLSGDQDWVGIFPKNSDNSWGNVLGWNWVENGSNILDKNAVSLPAGEYEIRLFFHNEYGANAEERASDGFNVLDGGNGREFGTEGPYLDKVKSVKTSENGKVNNAIYYVEGVDNLPTVIFMSGWKSNLQSYDGFLTYVASLGYCVIAKQERGKCFTPSVYHQELTDRLNMVHNTYHADISKLGIIGHSSGGGVVHNLMDYFKSHNIAGKTKSVVMSLDGWFPFGTTEAMLNAFDTPTLLMQFGGNDGRNTNGIHPDWDDYAGQPYHHYQDPKINLAIFQSLTRANVDKEYIVLEANNNHSYFAGTYASLITKRDFLAPVDEFLNHTIGRGDAMNLIDNSGEVITNDLASEYRYYCHTAGFDFCDLNHLTFP